MARSRIRELEAERKGLESQLATVSDDLSAGVDYIRGWLALLSDPHGLYLKATDQMRRELNQAIFKHFWVLDEERIQSDLTEPAQLLIEAQRAWAQETRATTEEGQDSESSSLAWPTSGEPDAYQNPSTWSMGSGKRRLVVLARSLSNSRTPLARAITAYRKLDLTRPSKKRERARGTKRAKRLNTVELERIKAGYIAGASSTELAKAFDVSRKTICLKLQAMGVSMRSNVLTPDQVTTATGLYAAGTSAARIAGQLGVGKDAVRFALIRAGVQLRDTHGRVRCT